VESPDKKGCTQKKEPIFRKKKRLYLSFDTASFFCY
jgi:hypothetical protein